MTFAILGYCFIVLLCAVLSPAVYNYILLWHDVACAESAVNTQSTNQHTEAAVAPQLSPT